MTSTAITTALLSALAQEQRGLIQQLVNPRQITHAGRRFWLGDLHGQQVVLALSKIGKVAAATTAAALIEHFGVQRMVFTGVAGGLKHGVNVGDVVVGDSFVQHDLDVSPLFPRFEVPLYGRTRFDGDEALTAALLDASQRALSDSCMHPDFPVAKVHLGLIACGDRFVSGAVESDTLRTVLLTAGHEVFAVEMECAAVAQVCHDYGVPFGAVRTISDRADDAAHVDFQYFVDQVASKYAQVIMQNFLRSL